MHTLQCAFCGTPFEAQRSTRRFCCDRCKSLHGFREAAKAVGVRVCKQCGNDFEPAWPKSEFCCRSCSTTWLHAHRWAAKARTCACGASYTSQRKDRKECDVCLKSRKSQAVMSRRAKTNPRLKRGIGSGGSQHYHPEAVPEGSLSSELSPRLRADILKRDGNLCRVCRCELTQAIAQVHHVDMCRQNNQPNNLVSLCRNCHGEVHHEIKTQTWNGQTLDRELCIRSFFAVLNCRLKTAENIGELSESRQSDLKAHGDMDMGCSPSCGCGNTSQGQRLPAEACEGL